MISTTRETATFSTIKSAVLCTTRWQRFATLPLLLLMLHLQGCSTISTIATGPVGTGMSVVSFITTGKGLFDHALDFLSEQDCRLLEGLLDEERDICEPEGSVATLNDFKGLIAFNETEKDIKRLQTHENFALYLSLSTEQSIPSLNNKINHSDHSAPNLEMDLDIRKVSPRVVAAITLQSMEETGLAL